MLSEKSYGYRSEFSSLFLVLFPSPFDMCFPRVQFFICEFVFFYRERWCAGVFNLCAVKIKWNFKITKQNFPLKKEVFIYIRPSHRSSVVSKEKTFVNGNLYTTAFKIRKYLFLRILTNRWPKAKMIWSFSRSLKPHVMSETLVGTILYL